jgi:UDP-N-acetylmuramate dehydrogenase
MQYEEAVSLSRFTSLHVGGPARYFFRAKSTHDVLEALRFAQQRGLPFFILGSGSNTLFSDEGYRGVIIHMEDRRLDVSGNRITAGSGVFMRQLVTKALQHRLRGLEDLAGIPGTVGGSVRGNAGTWTTEMKDVVVSVEVALFENHAWQVRTLSTRACAFGYRDSIFKHQPEWVVLSATFELQEGDAREGAQRVAEDMRKRRERQPYEAPSAGSVFKNPDKEHSVFSGQLIEQCGLKGLQVGQAQVSQKHANFILNRGGATSRDIRALITTIQDMVEAQHKVRLEPEIVIVDTN